MRTRVSAKCKATEHPQHSGVPELDKRPGLDRAVDIRNILQAEIDQLLIFLLTQPSNEARTRQLNPQSIRRQAVLREAKVK